MTLEASWVSAACAATVMLGAVVLAWFKMSATADKAKAAADELKIALAAHSSDLKVSLRDHEQKFVPRQEVVSIAVEAANKVGEAAAKDLAEFKLKVSDKYVDKETYNVGIEANSRKLDTLTAKLDRILEWLFTGNLPEVKNGTPPPPRNRRGAA